MTEHQDVVPGELEVSRRSLIAGAGIAGLALGAGGLFSDAALAAAGKQGPRGFTGASRYQYGPATAPGRAIAAAKKLVAAGKAPKTLVVGLYAGSVGNYSKGYPAGPSMIDMWQQYTGVKVKIVPVGPADASAKAARMAATKDGSHHIMQMGMADNGNLAEAGLLVDLSPYVAKYKPDWNDPKWGYVGGKTATQWMNYYNGKPYTVTSDGDFQVFYIRKDLWEDETEQKNFKAKYGYELAPPQTWDQVTDMAEFFTRPDKNLLGLTDLRSPAWGPINFIMRYISTGNPVAYYFDDNMKPLVDGPGGVKAMKHLVDTIKFGSKDALTWTYVEQYGNWGQKGAAMTIGFSNMTKFMKKGGPFDKGGQDAGAVTMAIPMPGWKVGGTLVQHTSIYFNASNGVNKYSPANHHEFAYTFLQWISSGQLYTWLTANPGGYQDPCKVACMTDPLVRQSYTPTTIDVLKKTIPLAAPSFSSIKGAPEYLQAVDQNMQKAQSGQSSPEAAVKQMATDFEAITNRNGRAKVAKAWVASKAGWPKQPAP